eukprot:gene199-97_t
MVQDSYGDLYRRMNQRSARARSANPWVTPRADEVSLRKPLPPPKTFAVKKSDIGSASSSESEQGWGTPSPRSPANKNVNSFFNRISVSECRQPALAQEEVNGEDNVDSWGSPIPRLQKNVISLPETPELLPDAMSSQCDNEQVEDEYIQDSVVSSVHETPEVSIAPENTHHESENEHISEHQEEEEQQPIEFDTPESLRPDNFEEEQPENSMHSDVPECLREDSFQSDRLDEVEQEDSGENEDDSCPSTPSSIFLLPVTSSSNPWGDQTPRPISRSASSPALPAQSSTSKSSSPKQVSRVSSSRGECEQDSVSDDDMVKKVNAVLDLHNKLSNPYDDVPLRPDILVEQNNPFVTTTPNTLDYRAKRIQSLYEEMQKSLYASASSPSLSSDKSSSSQNSSPAVTFLKKEVAPPSRESTSNEMSGGVSLTELVKPVTFTRTPVISKEPTPISISSESSCVREETPPELMVEQVEVQVESEHEESEVCLSDIQEDVIREFSVTSMREELAASSLTKSVSEESAHESVCVPVREPTVSSRQHSVCEEVCIPVREPTISSQRDNVHEDVCIPCPVREPTVESQLSVMEEAADEVIVAELSRSFSTPLLAASPPSPIQESVSNHTSPGMLPQPASSSSTASVQPTPVQRLQMPLSLKIYQTGSPRCPEEYQEVTREATPGECHESMQFEAFREVEKMERLLAKVRAEVTRSLPTPRDQLPASSSSTEPDKKMSFDIPSPIREESHISREESSVLSCPSSPVCPVVPNTSRSTSVTLPMRRTRPLSAPIIRRSPRVVTPAVGVAANRQELNVPVSQPLFGMSLATGPGGNDSDNEEGREDRRRARQERRDARSEPRQAQASRRNARRSGTDLLRQVRRSRSADRLSRELTRSQARGTAGDDIFYRLVGRHIWEVDPNEEQRLRSRRERSIQRFIQRQRGHAPMSSTMMSGQTIGVYRTGMSDYINSVINPDSSWTLPPRPSFDLDPPTLYTPQPIVDDALRQLPQASSTKRQEQEDCSICLDKCRGSIITLKCLHFFHSKCIKTWLKHDMSCPLCKEKVC